MSKHSITISNAIQNLKDSVISLSGPSRIPGIKQSLGMAKKTIKKKLKK